MNPNMDKIFSNRVATQLWKQKNSTLWRNRELLQPTCISFCSNDYLGLSKHPKIIQAFQSGANKYGIGSTGSCVLGGYSLPYQALEEALAEFTGYPRALLFSTGYIANLAIITTLVQQLKIQKIYSDRLNHASINDALLLSRTAFKRFHHRNYHHLNALFLQHQQKFHSLEESLCLTEGLFGVDGDIADLPTLIQVTKKHSSLLIIDDAHGFGVLGKKGGGTLEYHRDLNNISPTLKSQDICLTVGTFGKAFGTFGAFVVAREDLIELLIQFARPYIFTTAMPPALVESTLASLKIIQQEYWRREYLKNLIILFRSGAKNLGLTLLPSETPIQLLLTYDPKTTLQYSALLKQRGFWVGALRPPTVPDGLCRLRINLSVNHSVEDISRLLEALQCAQNFIQKQ